MIQVFHKITCTRLYKHAHCEYFSYTISAASLDAIVVTEFTHQLRYLIRKYPELIIKLLLECIRSVTIQKETDRLGYSWQEQNRACKVFQFSWHWDRDSVTFCTRAKSHQKRSCRQNLSSWRIIRLAKSSRNYGTGNEWNEVPLIVPKTASS